MSQLMLGNGMRSLPLVPPQGPGHPVTDSSARVLIVVVVVAGADRGHLGPVLHRDPLDF